MRRFRLPENAKMDQVRASMENGELTITVPRVDEKKPEGHKAIDISGSVCVCAMIKHHITNVKSWLLESVSVCSLSFVYRESGNCGVVVRETSM
ncbi:SHSP domain-containing protein [Psidium guajava]|nr:SHSP domain-containing protein [Psidium guajava]